MYLVPLISSSRKHRKCFQVIRLIGKKGRMKMERRERKDWSVPVFKLFFRNVIIISNSPPQRGAAVHVLYHHWSLTSSEGSCCPCPVSPLATHLLRGALLSMSCITIGHSPPQRGAAVHVLYHHRVPGLHCQVASQL